MLASLASVPSWAGCGKPASADLDTTRVATKASLAFDDGEPAERADLSESDELQRLTHEPAEAAENVRQCQAAGLVLESYAIEPCAPAPPDASTFADPAGAPPCRFRLVVRGRGFVVRAMPATVRAGADVLTACAIAADGRQITCYLDELPEAGGRIAVSYGRGKTCESPEGFSRRRRSTGPE